MEKLKIDVIIVKKEVGGLVSSYKMDRKIFKLSDFIKKYPFLDINNREYFEVKSVSYIPSRTKVKYQGEFFYVEKIVNFRQLSNELISFFEDDIVPVYKLVKSTCDRKLKSVEVDGTVIEVAETYWFINSSGKNCSTELGKDSRADRWRKRVGNYFTTKEECRKMYEKLTEPDSKINIEIIYTK